MSKRMLIVWAMIGLLFVVPPAVLLFSSVRTEDTRRQQDADALRLEGLPVAMDDADPEPANAKVGELLRVDDRGAMKPLAVTLDGKHFLTSGQDRMMRLWDAKTRKELWSFGTAWEPSAIAVSPDGNTALVAAANQIFALDLANRTQRYVLYSPTGSPTCLAYAPNGQTALSGGNDHLIRVWNLQTCQELGMLDAQDSVVAVAYSADGQRFVAATLNGHLLEWNALTGHVLRRARIPQIIRMAVFSHDGAKVLVGLAGTTPELWDLQTMKRVQDFKGLRTTPRSVALSRDGRRVAAMAFSGEIVLWDADTGQKLTSVSVNNRSGDHALEFLPGGRHLLVGGAGLSVVAALPPASLPTTRKAEAGQ